MPLALRSWLRYVVPLILLGLVACVPVLAFAFRVRLPADVAAARGALRIGWALAATGILVDVLVVAAAAPAVRALAIGAPVTQWTALRSGAGNLVRAVVPWLVALSAVVLGGVALVVPGVLLVVLFSLAGASTQLGAGPAAALTDAVGVARAQLPRLALVVAGLVLVHLAIAAGLQLALVPTLTKKPPVPQLVGAVLFVRWVAVAVTALAPIAACVLAARYSDAKRG